MIEFRWKLIVKHTSYGSESWCEFDKDWNIKREDFKEFDFKIDGVVFEEWNDEFTKKLMWFKLGERNGYDCTE